MSEAIENKANEPSNEEAKYTDAQVDAMFDKKFAKIAEKHKAETEKAVADAVAQVEEAYKLSQMNEKEKAEHERKAMADELAKYKRMEIHNAMMTEARNMLKADEITLADDLVSVLVTEDAETTRNAVKAFSAAFRTAVDDAVKSKLASTEPKRGSTATGMTKEQIMEIKDPTKRREAISENMHLFEGMLNGGK